MKIDNLSYDGFLKAYDKKITVVRLYQQISAHKVNKLVKIQKIQLDSFVDFHRLENLKLVWYQNTAGKSVGWGDEDARHIELKSKNSEEAYQPKDREKIAELIRDFKLNGLRKDLEIISVTDSELDKEIVIDGVHRAVAIYRLYQNEPDSVKKLLSSHHGIYLINLQSPAAGIIFPCDFLNFY